MLEVGVGVEEVPKTRLDRAVGVEERALLGGQGVEGRIPVHGIALRAEVGVAALVHRARVGVVDDVGDVDRPEVGLVGSIV